MQIKVTGVARIRHAVSGKIHTIKPDDLGWGIVWIEECEAGTDIMHGAIVDHRELDRVFWTLWEYPEGTINDRETDVGEHELVKDFTITLEPDDVE